MARWVVHVLVIYKELWLTEFESFPFAVYFPVRSALSYKENTRFGDSRSERGKKELQCEWEKERVSFESVSAHLIVCNLCPAVSCLSNRMTSMRKWNYGQTLSTGLMLGALCVCVCMLGRDDDLSEPAGYELCLPNRPTAAGLQWCGPYTHLLSLQAGMLFLISDFIALPQWAHQEEHTGGQSLQQRSDLVKSSSPCDKQ